MLGMVKHRILVHFHWRFKASDEWWCCIWECNNDRQCEDRCKRFHGLIGYWLCLTLFVLQEVRKEENL